MTSVNLEASCNQYKITVSCMPVGAVIRLKNIHMNKNNRESELKLVIFTFYSTWALPVVNWQINNWRWFILLSCHTNYGTVVVTHIYIYPVWHLNRHNWQFLYENKQPHVVVAHKPYTDFCAEWLVKLLLSLFLYTVCLMDILSCCGNHCLWFNTVKPLNPDSWAASWIH